MPKILSSILILVLLTVSLPGQSVVQLESMDNRSKKKYKAAIKCMQENKYDEAEMKFMEVLEKYPELLDARQKLSQIYIDQGQNNLAIEELMYIDNLVTKPSPRLKLKIADLAEEEGDFDLAVSQVETILNLDLKKEALIESFNHRLAELKFRKQAYNNPVPFNSIPLPPQINTDHHEYLPVFNADNSMLVFCRSEIINGRRQHEDLYYSHIDSAGEFQEAMPIDELNTPLNEGTHSLSPNGQILVFSASDRRDSYGGFDLYISFKKDGQWGKAHNMGAGINSRFKDTQPCIAQNNRTIYFSSHRKGGYGGADIWRIDINEDNSWSKPTNLGPEINTRGNEESPFLHPDNKTLYFRSNGHIGMGDFDIYMSKQKSHNTWDTVTNLGYPINTKGSEGALFVTLDGRKAYYATDASTGKNLDIHYFDLPEALMPDPVSYLKIQVTDAISGLDLSAQIELKELSDNKKSIYLRTNTRGQVLSPVEIGEYALTIERKGYLFHSEYILVDLVRTANKPLVYNVSLIPIPDTSEIGESNKQAIILNNIFFRSGSDQLLTKSESEIYKLYDLLKNTPELRIRIIGHTDNVGSEEDNQVLSENRAKAVFNALIQKGISVERLEYIGMGESDPIADNESIEGRKRNRRTEFIIIE